VQGERGQAGGVVAGTVVLENVFKLKGDVQGLRRRRWLF
jgi:hypothetical protein